MPDPGQARKRGHQPAVLVPKEMLDQARLGSRPPSVAMLGNVAQEPAISRISMLAPGIIIPDIPFATSSALS